MTFEMEICDVDTRYSFTAQFLIGAAMFARQARDIEDNIVESKTEEQRANNRACVVSAIMQSAASIESEISEILMYGPGHHLGSNGTDSESLEFLSPLSDVLEYQSTLDKYLLLLHLLRKESFQRGKEPYQSAALLIRLRNELVHYKSMWGKELKKRKLIKQLKGMRFRDNPLCPDNVNFFPHKFLSSSCASWAVETAVTFIDAVHDRLNIKSPLEAYADRLSIPEIIKEQ